MLALFAVSPAGAEAPYEPNDTILSAAGPLALGQTYSAALETASDQDFFYFYVTASGTSRVSLTVQNLGGSGKSSDIDATILDGSDTPLAGQAFMRRRKQGPHRHAETTEILRRGRCQRRLRRPLQPRWERRAGRVRHLRADCRTVHECDGGGRGRRQGA